jgi:hypothetical protein
MYCYVQYSQNSCFNNSLYCGLRRLIYIRNRSIWPYLTFVKLSGVYILYLYSKFVQSEHCIYWIKWYFFLDRVQLKFNTFHIIIWRLMCHYVHILQQKMHSSLNLWNHKMLRGYFQYLRPMLMKCNSDSSLLYIKEEHVPISFSKLFLDVSWTFHIWD